MRKAIAVFAVMVVLLTGLWSALALATETSKGPDGVYEGVAGGHNGEMTVSVEFKDGIIHDVKVIRHVETAGVTENAIAEAAAKNAGVD